MKLLQRSVCLILCAVLLLPAGALAAGATGNKYPDLSPDY